MVCVRGEVERYRRTKWVWGSYGEVRHEEKEIGVDFNVLRWGYVSLPEQASGQDELKVHKTVSSTWDMMNLRVQGSSEQESSLPFSLLYVCWGLVLCTVYLDADFCTQASGY